MLQRKMYAELLAWKKEQKKECILLKGARQVGKTYLIRAFGAKEYKSFIEINFQTNPEFKEIFNGSLFADEIYKKMSILMPGINFIEGKTLIFLDEIQKCSKARTALKFLAEDRRYDVIASGSLLGLSYGLDADKEVEPVESVPVGYERPLHMYSLDFEEFLVALGYGRNDLETLRSHYLGKTSVPLGINEKFESILREFLIVGGMPEAVADYVEHKDFSRVDAIQEKIMSSYLDDIAQHAKGAEAIKVRRCYDSLPKQLARENKKFRYSAVEAKGNSRKFKDSVSWLIDAEMVYRAYNVSLSDIPLKAYEKEDEFKIYMNDTGLLLHLYGFETKKALYSGKLKGPAKGGIYENFLAETLVKKGNKLHYYRPSEEMELEFLLERDGEVLPIEVKAGNNPTKSLDNFIQQNKPSLSYKFIKGNVGYKDAKLSLPHYMAMFL